MARFIIIGAGMAGLLAGAMLREEVSSILEAQSELPNNHSAVLRFRSPVVGDVLGIPFRKVKVLKATEPCINPVADALSYSRKTNGSLTLRSILSADGEIVERYIAPPDLIDRMRRKLMATIQLDCKIEGTGDFVKASANDTRLIWTGPMPVLMSLLGWKPRSEFRSTPGINLVVKLKPGTDAHCSLYIPDPSCVFSRISITGDVMIGEISNPVSDPKREWMPNEDILTRQAFQRMGLRPEDKVSSELVKQKYAKILPIDEAERREFIIWASSEHNVYSLGRFATWRPGLLLDDVVKDVRIIRNLAEARGNAYDHHKKDA